MPNSEHDIDQCRLPILPKIVKNLILLLANLALTDIAQYLIQYWPMQTADVRQYREKPYFNTGQSSINRHCPISNAILANADCRYKADIVKNLIILILANTTLSDIGQY